jgi:hypothetical protein
MDDAAVYQFGDLSSRIPHHVSENFLCVLPDLRSPTNHLALFVSKCCRRTSRRIATVAGPRRAVRVRCTGNPL